MRVITATQLRRGSSVPLQAPLAYASRFDIASICVELRTDQSALAAALNRTYADHRSDAPADFTYTVCRYEQGYCFTCAHDGSWFWDEGELPGDALAFLTDAALMSALVHADGALQSMHAAAVEYRGAGAAIVGDSTAGKTTTLLACARSGMRVYSDERALLRGGVLQPFLRRCNVRRGGRDLLLRDDGGDALAQVLADAESFSLREVFGERHCAAPAPLRAVFVLKALGTRASVCPTGAAQALPAISRWFDTRGDAMDRLGSAIATLRAAQCFALTLGTPAQTASTIRSTIEALA